MLTSSGICSCWSGPAATLSLCLLARLEEDRSTIASADCVTEEYKRISEFMRTYLLLRLYRLTLLLGTSGAIVTALASENIQARGAVVILLPKVSALGISAAFAVMDFSASGHWNGQAADNR